MNSPKETSSLKLRELDKPFTKPGALLELVRYQKGLREFKPIIFFKGKASWSPEKDGGYYVSFFKPEPGDIFLVTGKPFFGHSTTTNSKSRITIQLLLGEKLLLASWQYSLYGFNTFFNLLCPSNHE